MSKRKKSSSRKTILRKPKNESVSKGIDSKDGEIFVSAIVGGVIGNLIFPGVGGVIIGSLVGGSVGVAGSKELKMAKIPVFYSFHFDNDVMRVQQIRNIGSIEGNSPTTPNEWERLKRSGKNAVQNWIDQNRHKRGR